MKPIYTILALLLLTSGLQAQPVSDLNTSFNARYYYPIDSAQALKLMSTSLTPKDTSYFLRSPFVRKMDEDSLDLPTGNYIKVYPNSYLLQYEYIPVTPWYIYSLDNKEDLLIQFMDNRTHVPMQVQSVLLDETPLRYDTKTMTYVLSMKRKDNGILSVRQNGYTFYYRISNNNPNNASTGFLNNLLYNTPLKYVMIPRNYIASLPQQLLMMPAYYTAALPIDGFQSLKRHYPAGTIQLLQQKTQRLRDRFRKDRNRDYYSYDKYESYFYFSKPKFRKGDTIKFKAYILNSKKQKWYNKPVRLSISNGYKNPVYLTTLKPAIQGGGYNYQFTIADSMDVRLNSTCYVYLETADSERLSGHFYYENYDLKKSTFKIELPDGYTQVKGKPFMVKFIAKDENELPMADTRAFVYLLSVNISNARPDQLYVPDTIWKHTMPITKGEEALMIPDSLFPDARIDYRLGVEMKNSENERTNMESIITYQYKAIQIKMELSGGNISITADKPDIEKVRVYAKDRFGIVMFDTLLMPPCSFPVSNIAYQYFCEAFGSIYTLSGDYTAGLVPVTERAADSISFSLSNPRHLPVVYHIYKTNKEIKRGTEKDFPFSMESDKNSLYYLLTEYVWAGNAETDVYTIPLAKNNINLQVSQPAVVTPGKESEISITATNYKGQPVKDLSLLAYSYTGKFENDGLKPLPGIGTRYKPRTANSNFTITNFNGSELYAAYNREKGISLNYAFWNKIFRLDTSWAYRFHYPKEDTIIYTSYDVEEQITQIAPFIMEDGVLQPVYYVTIDYSPVYFGFTNVKLPYSFKVDGNYHEIKVRTRNKLVSIPYVLASPGKKSIFSIDQGKESKKHKYYVESMPDTLTTKEREYLSNYVLRLEEPYYKLQYAYLERTMDNVQYIDLYKNGNYNSTKYRYFDDDSYYNNSETQLSAGTVGPILGRYWKYNAINQFELLFNFEKRNTYTFNTNYLKLQPASVNDLIPPYSPSTIPLLGDKVCTRKAITDRYEAQFNRSDYGIDLRGFNNSFSGKANLVTEYGKDIFESTPAYIALSRTDSNGIFNIYQSTLLASKNIPEGKYQLIFIKKEGDYYATDTFEIRANGTTFYRIAKVQRIKDQRTDVIDSLYRQTKINASKYLTVNPALRPNDYDPAFYNRVPGTYWGVVVDSLDVPIPGVYIKINGTNISTRTNSEGKFKIVFPIRTTEDLIISTYGFPDQYLEPRQDMKIVFKNTPKGQSYHNEVEMHAYGSVSKGNYVGAADVVTEKSISMSPMPAPGVSLPSFGKLQDIMIEDNSTPSKSITGIALQGNGKSNGATTPLYVIDGTIYTGDAAVLDPSFIESVSVIQDATAVSIYGSRGANGVVIITTKKDAALPDIIKNGLKKPAMPMDESMMVSSLRNNFKDDAYWQPELITDKNGKVTFDVKFPDDITSWKTIVLATNKRRQTGLALGNIKSYKPVTASLYIPRFMVAGDTAKFIGKAMNYIGDTIPATTSFFQNNLLQSEKKFGLSAFNIDTLNTIAFPADSLKLKYMLTKENGYFDGEERTIPVLRQGVRIADGAYQTLDSKDTTFTIYPDKNADTLHLYATASIIDLLLDEIDVVRNYGYMCNEQMASKILAMVTKQRIYAAYHRPFDPLDMKYTQDVIDKLLKNKNKDYLWGWWGTGNGINWISGHVLNALTAARKMGYNIPLDFTPLTNALVQNLTMNNRSIDLSGLRMLAELDMKINYEKYINQLEQKEHISLNAIFELMQLRQKVNLPYNTDKLTAFMETDVFGDIHWKDTARYVYNNEVLTTLNALKIVQNDTAIHINKNKIINWLLKQRNAEGWRNTYESALIIEAIGQTIPLYDTSKLKPVLQFTGALQEDAASFPYKKTLITTEPIQVRKTGVSPVYFTWYTYKWDTTNNNLGNNFKVNSHFEFQNDTVEYLPAGAYVNLKVDVTVEKSAEYVMIEIPVPAGCSYRKMEQNFSGYEIHREYYDDKVSIFCQHLPKGNYTYSVALLSKYRGNYTLNPAKVELMYFPVFYGREKMKRVEIRE